MGRAGQKSNGNDCLGVFRELTKTCKRGRTGKPVILAPRYCKVCGEQRCKAHCRCGRRGTHTAHSAPRGGSAPAGPSRPSAPPAATVAVVAPVGRASAQTWELLTTVTWYRTFCKDVCHNRQQPPLINPGMRAHNTHARKQCTGKQQCRGWRIKSRLPRPRPLHRLMEDGERAGSIELMPN